MEINEYTFHILPKEAYEKNKDTLKENQEDWYLFDEYPFWEYKKINIDIFLLLSKYHQKINSKYEDEFIFGKNKSNRIIVSFENGFVNSALFIINFLSDYKLFIDDLLKFIILNEFVIIGEDLKIVQLNYTFLNNKIENSYSFKKYHELLGG